MFSKFTEDAQKILIMSKREMQELKHPYVSSEHLLLSILHYANKNFLSFLEQYNLTYSSFKNKLIDVIGMGSKQTKWFLYTPLLKKIIENAILDSKDENTDVSVEQLFLSLLEEGEGVANRIMMSMDIDLDSLYEQFSNQLIREGKSISTKLAIEDFAVDFTEEARNGNFDPVIGRDEEICHMIEILLRRKKCNPLLIGDAGVGKTALVEELARRIVLGLVPNELKNMRILSVAISSLVAGTKYRGEFEERINKMIEELEIDRARPAARGTAIEIDFTLTSPAPTQREASIKDIIVQLDNNTGTFTYTDNWGTSGNGTITFANNTITLRLETTQAAQGALWGVEGIYTFSYRRMD